MLDRVLLYDLIYALAARDGREALLFGSCAPLAREAFVQSLAGEAFPEVWFEIPLAGEPWFDLHVLTAREALQSSQAIAPSMDECSAKAMRWFGQKSAAQVRQLALSYDVSSGNIDSPAVQLLMWGDHIQTTSEFLATVANEEASAAYQAFVSRIPHGWFACYSGVFPQRPNMGIRVECVLRNGVQQAYVQDPTRLEQDLRGVGIDTSADSLLPWCAEMARTPFPIEFQFNVLPDGTVANTLGVSLRFNCPPGTDAWHGFDANGAAGTLMQWVQDKGLADDRWRSLGNTTFSKRIRRADESAQFYCFPAFLKLRWRNGQPLDAKAYLLCGCNA